MGLVFPATPGPMYEYRTCVVGKERASYKAQKMGKSLHCVCMCSTCVCKREKENEKSGSGKSNGRGSCFGRKWRERESGGVVVVTTTTVCLASLLLLLSFSFLVYSTYFTQALPV